MAGAFAKGAPLIRSLWLPWRVKCFGLLKTFLLAILVGFKINPQNVLEAPARIRRHFIDNDDWLFLGRIFAMHGIDAVAAKFRPVIRAFAAALGKWQGLCPV